MNFALLTNASTELQTDHAAVLIFKTSVIIEDREQI